MVRVGINGFGRIGRAFLKASLGSSVKVVAINDLTDTQTLAFLFKHDSAYGVFNGHVSYGENFLIINGRKVYVSKEKDPLNLPWRQHNVKIAVESTGLFTDGIDAIKHLSAGAKRVVISAPGKNVDKTLVMGVNEKKFEPKRDHVISMGSCTTNCLAPVAKILEDNFKIKKAFMTTVHAYTNDQRVLDAPHKDLRRARTAAVNIIPTTSGATKSVAEVIPSLKGKMDGLALRVPVQVGSVTDFVAVLGKHVAGAETLNSVFERCADGKMKGILDYTDEPIVSSDIIGNPHSSIVDGLSTMVNGNMVKVISWYDNEWGYSNRLVDLIKYIK